MLTYFIALFWALVTPTHNHINSTTMDDDGDTGGETGTIPPKPPTP